MKIRTTALAILAAIVAALLPATAANAGATWTTVRSVSQSTVSAKVIFKDGSFNFLDPGESTHYYRSEPRVVQTAYGVCIKVSVNGGTFWMTNDRNYELVDDRQYAFKFWRC